ncbi:outer membrane beta-barrel family protein [Rhizosphaericola mali]|uniref:Outer membrane beta-barrel protein n=1 Tax=Rhizosphaericola mali TaxID=2545455 RepID=A0A5P2G441_9BACT|nr:outer membrane beta-barrel family protein [Rhizosphaericola mali]QES90594.1 outer membrane beta-barrel protein [Rhizosphaericola mali]
MAKRTMLMIIGLMVSMVGFSQIKISGKISDINGTPISFATIKFTKDSKSFGKISDSAGTYILTLPDTGLYVIAVSSFNYRDSISNYNVSQKEQIKDFQLRYDNASELGGVVVSTKKKKPLIEKKIDRLIFNVAESPLSIGGTAWDVLQHTPLISAKNSGELSLIGKSASVVYINNRKSFLSGEDLMNYLSAMPSDNIVSIEVITAPPASYDAGNGSSVINIVLRKVLDNGLNGSVTLTDMQATYNRQRATAQLNYKYNRYTQSLTAGGTLGKTFSKFYNTINYFDIGQKETLDEKFINNGKPISIATNMNYELTPLSLIGGVFEYTHNNSHSFDYALDNIMGSSKNQYWNNNLGKEKTNLYSGNLNYKYSGKSRQRILQINLDYFQYINSNEATFLSYFDEDNLDIFNGNNSYTRQKAYNYSAKVDYSQLIFGNINFDAGIKYGYTKTNNPYLFYNYTTDGWSYNDNISNHFIYKEGINAAYFDLQKKITSHLDVKAGARIENTDIKTIQLSTDENHHQNYTKILPSAYISYEINNNNNLSFSIKNDFIRPSFSAMNPFRDYSSNKIIEMGNAFLRPGNSLDYELSYIFKRNYIFMAQYSNQTNLSGQLQTIIAPDTLLYKQANYGMFRSFGLVSIVNQSIIKAKWNINLTNSIQWKTLNTNADNIEAKETFPIYNVALNQTFTNLFKTGINGSLYGSYTSKFANANSVSLKPFGEVDFGFVKDFTNIGWKISMYVDDIFKTNIYKGQTIGNSTFNSILSSYYDDRRIRISVVKNFGNKRVRTKKNDDAGNASEKNRL